MRAVHGSVNIARSHVARFEGARFILRGIEERITPWLRVPEEELPRMVPPPEVPRAFNSSFEGCPVHGMELFRFGNYSWIMDPFNRPWKLNCPVGGEEYPSNDFQAFLDSGMGDRSLLTGDYPDDGWGWKEPGDAHANWFVAYYCHWYWYNFLIPAVLALSRAYLLTERADYGRKGLILLARIAEIYPDMDYNRQSRYAKEFRPQYTGKIVNSIWETNVIRSLGESVANLMSYVAEGGGEAIGKTKEEVIELLEERILLEGLRGIREDQIVGNYGMHQDAALVVLKALDRHEETERWLDLLLNNPRGGYYHQGIAYAMDNFIYREGVAYENAPGYCFTWSRNLLSIACHLKSMRAQFPNMPKLRRMLEVPERIICLGKFTPAIGDSGSVTSGKIELSQKEVKKALRIFPETRFAAKVKPEFSDYEDLFSSLPVVGPASAAPGRRVGRKKSDCLGGYGLVILRAGDLECSLFSGRQNGHGHYDRLGVEVFGCGQRLTPDLGYPQFAAESKDPPAWERNTIAHNTVTVNERRQETGNAGSLKMFHSAPWVEVAEVSSNRTYRAATTYMRTLAIIHVEQPFLVDIFRVRGGFAHDYSIHGFDGQVTTGGIKFEPRAGTLAGPSVPYGYLYDDLELEVPEKERSYYSYAGSGFSYLYDVACGRPGSPWWAEWRGKTTSLKVFFPHTCHEAIVASGRPPKRPGNPESLRYAILRNRGQDLHSLYTAVGEAYRKKGSVNGVQSLRVESVNPEAFTTALMIHQGNLRHLVMSAIEPTSMKALGARFTGRFLVLTMDRSGEPLRVFMDGEKLSVKDLRVDLGRSWAGQVDSVHPPENSVTVEATNPPGKIEGSIAIFENSRRSSAFRVVAASEDDGRTRLVLDHNGRMGSLIAEKLNDRELRTETKLLFAGHGYYEGAHLVDAQHLRWLTIEEVNEGRIRLTESLGDFSFPQAYVYEYGPGDRVSVPSEFSLNINSRTLRGHCNQQCVLAWGERSRALGPGKFRMSRGREG